MKALAKSSAGYRFTLIASEADRAELDGLPENFKVVFYEKADTQKLEHIAFPLFLRRLGADLVHIPLNRIPTLMPKPYVVTVHDLSSLLFADRDTLSENIRSYFFRRGLIRADRVIAVSGSTRRAHLPPIHRQRRSKPSLHQRPAGVDRAHA